MTDRPAPQQRLAADLALLADALPRASCRATWFAAFWDVMGQQWPQIDKLRLDKFLLLVRRVFAAQVRYSARGEGCDEVAAVLAEWPFEESGDLRRVPLGLRLHVLDLWVDELEREGCLAEGDAEGRALVDKVGEMVQGLLHCPVKQVRERARESYDDDRLPWAEKGEDEDEEMDDDEEEWGGIDG